LNTGYITTIYSNFLAVKDSLTVTRRSIKKKVSILHRRTVFEESKSDDVNMMLKAANKEFADLIVLGLFASFERQLRDEILDKSSKLQEIIPRELGERMTTLAQREIERWRIGEIIDLFNFAVDGEVRGKLKQILQYRNWIAHGKNPNDLPSVRSTDPKTTYETIQEFVSQLKGEAK
jgi:hypothetical protein